MVRPGDELTIKLHRNLQCLSEKVIQGSAEVSQSSTAYVFTGRTRDGYGPVQYLFYICV